jgi:hypothetical protein
MKQVLVDFAKSHLLVILVFIVITLAYFSPLLEGKVLNQYDLHNATGMAQELTRYHEQTGEYAQWTNSMFSGMPAFHVGPTGARRTIFSYIAGVLRFGASFSSPFTNFMLYLLGFYILLLSFRLSPWLSGIGAAAFALSTYNILIISVGHINKAYAIAFMAPVIAGMLLTYRGKYLTGGLLFLLGLGLEIYSNHLQITYYLLILVLIVIITLLVFAFREKSLKNFIIASTILAVTAIFAVLPNVSNLWINYEISKQTMRGKPALSQDQDNQTSGLDKDYALDWSYGKAETFSIMIPDIKGGGTGRLGDNKNAMRKADQRFRDALKDQNRYWGDKTVTAGPVYAGAIIVFFFVAGLFIIKGSIRWWIIISTLLSIMLAWGRHFPGLSYFFLDHVPLYHKFRTVEMTLVIAAFNIPLMAFLAIRKIIEEPDIITKEKKRIFIAYGLTGGLSLVFYLLPGMFTFFSERELSYFNGQIANAGPDYAEQFRAFMDSLEDIRKYIFRFDAIRSFFFISAAFLLVWFYVTKKLKLSWLLAGLGFFILIDLWLVDRRYLNNDNFMTERQNQNFFAKTPADEYILNDPDPHFRVANLTVSPWQDATTSYYHKSIGGYHGAKLRRYQDLIEYYLSGSLEEIIQTLRTQSTNARIDTVLSRQQVLNMLNTKYIIYNPSYPPILNPYAMGNAWITGKIQTVNNPDEEILTLASTDLRHNAVVDIQFAGLLPDELNDGQTSGNVHLTEYRPDYLSYESELDRKSLVVFSEIYYEGGWKAYVDGAPVEHLRANYILRALPVNAGKHKIEFRFEFMPFETGEKISYAGSVLVLIILLAGFAYQIYLSLFKKSGVTG